VADADALHIGVDGRELTSRPTGVGRYLASVLREWAADTRFPHRLTVWVSTNPPAALAEFGTRITWAADPNSGGTWWEQTTLPGAARQAGVDVFFAAGYTAPLRMACPTVLAVYDVSFFAHPEWFGWREGLRRRWLTRQSAQRADSVITISEFSAGEIVRYLGVPRTHLHLAPPGAPARTADAHSTRPPLVLFVGSLFNRRRIPELIRGFALAAANVPDARLVLVGDNRTHPRLDPPSIAGECGVADRVEWRSYVDDVALQSLYRQARVFAFLSDYEGFAMTPLEAIAAGVPPILLDTRIAREVYGDGACLVMDDPASIGNAMTLLLTDPSQHAALLAAGQRRLERYSWSHTAQVIRHALEAAVVPA
jgi:glycosyltransferase involved in cell wall biosynthesis